MPDIANRPVDKAVSERWKTRARPRDRRRHVVRLDDAEPAIGSPIRDRNAIPLRECCEPLGRGGAASFRIARTSLLGDEREVRRGRTATCHRDARRARVPATSPSCATPIRHAQGRPPGARRARHFDSLNPLIVRGLAVPFIRGYVLESLMARGYDKPFTLYGLLARSVETDDDAQLRDLRPRSGGVVSPTASRSPRTT